MKRRWIYGTSRRFARQRSYARWERERKSARSILLKKKGIDPSLPPSRPFLSRFLFTTFSFSLLGLHLSLSFSFFRFTLIFSFSLFVCLSLQLGNCPRYFRIHRNATIADMHCRDDGKGGQWVIFHTLFAKMWRSNFAEGLNAGGALLLLYNRDRLTFTRDIYRCNINAFSYFHCRDIYIQMSLIILYKISIDKKCNEIK